MRAQSFRLVGSLSLTALVLVGASLWGFKRWRRYEVQDDGHLMERQNQAIKVVSESYFGSQEMRDRVASDFLEKDVKTGSCQWAGHPTWNGTPKNPSWFSETKDANGFFLTCDTTTRDKDGEEDHLEFNWDISDGRGVVGFRWGLSYLGEQQ